MQTAVNQNNPIAFKDFHMLRTVLFRYFYNPQYIPLLSQIIEKNIECINVEYDPMNYAFMVKIKKSEIKKSSRFVHCPVYYNKYISSIFAEFISAISAELSVALAETRRIYPDVDINVSMFLAEPESLCNLSIVTCMSDNIVMIKL